MAVVVIDTIKPKNQGTFPVVEAADVKVTNDKRLDTALNEKANASTVEALSTAVAGKASQSDVTALQTAVAGKASQSDLTALSNTVADKADKSALAETNTAVAGKQAALSEQQLAACNSGITSGLVTQIGTNTTAIAGKASQADLTALSVEVAEKADATDLTSTADDLQAQIDALITPVTQDAEVQNARVDTNGNSYTTLKARLDADQTNLSTLWNVDNHNLLNRGTIHNGYWQTSATSADGYKYISPVPVEKDVTYTVYPRARFVSLYNNNDENIEVLSDGTSEGIQSFTPEYDGYAYITFYTNEVANAKTYDASLYNDVTPFKVSQISDSAKYTRLETAESNITTNTNNITNVANNLAKLGLNVEDYINFNLLTHATIVSGYITDYGGIAESASYKSTENFIKVDNTLQYSSSRLRFIAWYSSADTSGFIRLDSFKSNEYSHDLTPPNNAVYARLTLYTDDYTGGDYYFRKGQKTLTETAHNAVVDTLGSIANLMYGLQTTSGYWQNNRHTDSENYCYYPMIPVLAEHTYTVYPRVRFVGLYDINGDYIADAPISGASSAGAQSFTPEYDGYAVITVYAADYAAGTAKVFDTTTDEHEYPPDGRPVIETLLPNDKVIEYISDNINVKINELKGLSIYNFGDSIAVGGGNSDVGYAKIIASLYEATCTDYAANGATLSRISGQSMGSVLTQIDNASSTAPDIILLEGGANDYTQYRVMGECTAETVFDSAQYDETTYIGALEKALYNLQTKYSGVPIIWIYTHRENTRTEKTDGTVTVNFTTMHDRSLEVCRKWAIPVVDLYNEGGLNTNWAAYRTAYTSNSDGTHPNDAGYKHFYIRPIVSKIKDILPVL